MYTISAVLIVKNESSCIEKCLNTVKDFDEIIVCDTGSIDNTVELAKKYTDKVYTDYKWEDSFCKARNHALSKATSDWVLSIDADEEFLNTVDEIKKVIQEAEDKGVKAVDIIQVSGRMTNYFPRLFKRCPSVFWNGNIHNHLSVTGGFKSDITIRYGYSEAHKLDPDRALRILSKEVKDNPNCSREKYYLAREYWYRKDYITAIYWFDEYLNVSKWLAERADAYLYVARCYWLLRKGDTARNYCLQAININANFKEALELMAEMSWDKNKSKWLEYASLANNEDVLFVRSSAVKKPITDQIEVCMVVYQRPERVPEILEQLKQQTVQNFNVNIWNNSGQKLDVSSFPSNRIMVIDSPENDGSKARFELAKKTTGNPIIFIDDDEILNTNFIEYNYEQYKKFGSNCIMGWYTRTFDKDTYWDSSGAKYGEEVDYIGTGGMILDRKILEYSELENIPEQFNKVEDLYLSYLARKNGIKLIKIDPTISIKPDDKDQFKKLYDYKENAFRELKKLGWKLIVNREIEQDRNYWDERYKKGNSGAGSYGEWLDFKLNKIKEVKDISTILDVGCGDLSTGTNVMNIFKDAKYLGLDISETAIKNAEDKKLGNRFTFKKIDNSVFCYPSDLVLCLDVLWHINRDEDYNNTLESLKNSWSKDLFLTVHTDDWVDKKVGSHVKIRKFNPEYFSSNYEKYLIPVGDKNIELYHFKKYA